MIKNYLLERISWIALFLCLQFLFIFIAFLDSTVPLHSVLYMVFIATIVFTLFLIIRYHKETKFYKQLEEWNHNLNVSGVPDPATPFENIVSACLTEQASLLNQTASKNRIMVEQEKDDLLSWIHEVKTPLTAMHLMIERIEDEGLKAPLKFEWLRIHLLLDQQLHQKRMAFIENDLYIENIEIETIVYQEIKTLQSWCIQKGIGVDLQLEIQEVLSDAKWLAFIIRQLLTNAVKYSERGEIIIKSYTEGDQTILEIKDFGRGIDPRDLPRIFDKGFTSTIDHHDNASTGMGLYLTKQAAIPLLLKIDVHSTRGEGTTFSLTFPQRNDFIKILGM